MTVPVGADERLMEIQLEHLFDIAIATWGQNSQIDMAVEECAELILAIQKTRRTLIKPGYDQRAELIHEIADVAIMIEQLQHMFDADWKHERAVRVQKLRDLLQM